MTTPEEDFVEFARSAAPQLRRTAYLLCRDWHLAQDLTQTALAKMFVRWKHITHSEQPYAYGRKVLLRVFFDHHRRRSSRELVTGVGPGSVPDRGDGSATARAELRLTLLDALGSIPPRDRAILILRYWEDQSIDTVADLLGIPVSTVKTQSARSLARLRTLLGHDHLAQLTLPD